MYTYTFLVFIHQTVCTNFTSLYHRHNSINLSYNLYHIPVYLYTCHHCSSLPVHTCGRAGGISGPGPGLDVFVVFGFRAVDFDEGAWQSDHLIRSCVRRRSHIQRTNYSNNHLGRSGTYGEEYDSNNLGRSGKGKSNMRATT